MVRVAREHRHASFIGIDINERNAGIAQDRVAREGLTNAIVVHDEAFKFISKSVPFESISAAHIYFPTPYMRDIREKNILGSAIRRRLVDQSFLNMLHSKCRPGAVFRLVTDHRDYFHDVSVAISKTDFVEVHWTTPISSSTFQNLVGTGLEKKQRALGKDIYFLQAIA